jgi:hypothetical protein
VDAETLATFVIIIAVIGAGVWVSWSAATSGERPAKPRGPRPAKGSAAFYLIFVFATFAFACGACAAVALLMHGDAALLIGAGLVAYVIAGKIGGFAFLYPSRPQPPPSATPLFLVTIIAIGCVATAGFTIWEDVLTSAPVVAALPVVLAVPLIVMPAVMVVRAVLVASNPSPAR